MDIDLVYMPVEDRATSLNGIDAALRQVAERIRRSMPAAQVTERRLATTDGVVKLTVRVPNIGEVKIEPNTVLRATVHPATDSAEPGIIAWSRAKQDEVIRFISLRLWPVILAQNAGNLTSLIAAPANAVLFEPPAAWNQQPQVLGRYSMRSDQSQLLASLQNSTTNRDCFP